MIAVVKRGFETAEAVVAQGAIVDTATWRNAEKMLKAGQIRPATASEVEAFQAGVDTVEPPSAPKPKARKAKAQ
jgi:hypothetical protein